MRRWIVRGAAGLALLGAGIAAPAALAGGGHDRDRGGGWERGRHAWSPGPGTQAGGTGGHVCTRHRPPPPVDPPPVDPGPSL